MGELMNDATSLQDHVLHAPKIFLPLQEPMCLALERLSRDINACLVPIGKDRFHLHYDKLPAG